MDTRRLLIGCDFTHVAAISTPVILQVQPTADPGVSIMGGQWASQPPMSIRGYTDLYGNPRARAVLPAGRSSSSTTRTRSPTRPRTPTRT